MPTNLVTVIVVPCSGGNIIETRIPQKAHKVAFITDGACHITDVRFTTEAHRFTNRDPASGGGNCISFQYDGSQIPSQSTDKGAVFNYSTPPRGNGTGVIKNQ
jgi:hypothetical protein